jgi:predicted Zn-dependent peptidase
VIHYSRHTLDNGLALLCNTDPHTPFVSINILYKVGSRDEQPHRTGLAHLLEHLMFGGSQHVDNFDQYLQQAGGESNATTGNDYTNYYITIPAPNIETALWLESDRMLHPTLTRRSLAVQKNVVVEEFKQHYLNRPYGDLFLHLKPLAYQHHPYRWNTIGVSPDHIRQTTLQEVKTFARAHYAPNNAIIAISGNITDARAFELVKQWFADIPPAIIPTRQLPTEPPQTAPRRLTIDQHSVPVPSDLITIAYHTGGRTSDQYYVADALTDILAGGESARLHANLVKKRTLFSRVDAYITADVDPGLVIIQGQPARGTTIRQAENAILQQLARLADNIPPRELQKVKNNNRLHRALLQTSYQAKANHLAVAEYLGNPDLVNREQDIYNAITPEDVQQLARQIFRPDNSSTLLYLASTATTTAS